MPKILVTGIGAIIGYGVIRSLRQSASQYHIVGTDIYPDAVGQAWTDYFVQAPLTSHNDYSKWLTNVIIKHSIDLVIPGIEQDVHFFSDHRDLFDNLKAKVVLNTLRIINLSRDKWLLDQELLAIKSPARIPTFLEGTFDAFASLLGLPFMLKPRSGYASKGIICVHDEQTFDFHSHKLGSELMAQPIVGSDDEEYTVAIFGDGLGNACASITLQRRLAQDGSTAKAWVRAMPSLDEAVSSLVKHFQPVGPTNLQLRKHNQEWKLLEINPRLSSSTSLRTAFGYNESEMAVAYYLNNKLPTQPILRKGFSVRYIEDYIVYDRDNF